MRRTLTALLAALMLRSLAACGSSGRQAGGATQEDTAAVSGVVNRLGDFLVLLTEDDTYAIFAFGG